MLGKPKPILGLGFPLCLFIPATISLFNPYALLHTYIKVTAPRLPFFFFRVVVVRWSGGWHCGGRLRSCSGVFFDLWWWVVGLFLVGWCWFFSALHARCLMHSFFLEGGRQSSPPSLSLSWSSFLGHGRATESRWAWPIRSVVAPLTPFLPNAVKNGPGRGWGTTTHGNRTVTQMLAPNSCSPKGEMLSVFFILCFLCPVQCLLSFFAVLLF